MLAYRQWWLACLASLRSVSSPGRGLHWDHHVSENADENTFADSTFPWQEPIGFEAFDAKLRSALSRIAIWEFSRNVQIMKWRL